MATRKVQFLEIAIFIFPLSLGDSLGFVIVDWSAYWSGTWVKTSALKTTVLSFFMKFLVSRAGAKTFVFVPGLYKYTSEASIGIINNETI